MNDYKVFRYNYEQVKQLKINISKNKNLNWAKILKKKLSDPREIVLFAYLVLPNTFSRPFTEYHYKFFDFLQIGIKEKISKGAKLPRGFGKSTIATKLGNIYEACYQIHNYILINSYSDSMSIEKLRIIREEFETNEVIKFIFGEPCQSKEEWQKSSIICFGKVRFQTVSTGQTARGFLWRDTRPSKVVSDDILDDIGVRNGETREKTKNWYLKALRNVLTPKGVMEFVNTPLHEDDLIENVFKKEGLFLNWETLHIKALENGQSIDENWKTTETLELEQKLDPTTFSQEMLGIPVSIKGGLIQYEDLRFWDILPEIKDIYIHADTTHTAKTTSDYFCLTAGGVAKDNNFYIADFILDKVDVEKQARLLISFFLQFNGKVKKITFDEKSNNGFGFWAKKLAREEFNLSLPLEPLGYQNDKVRHFQPHIPHFKSNRVYLPRQHRFLKTALDQLLSFPQNGVHDDFVDGLSGVLDNFFKRSQTLEEYFTFKFKSGQISEAEYKEALAKHNINLK